MTTSTNTLGPAGSTAAKALGIASALAVAAGGLLHLRLWDDRYRDLPDDVIPGVAVVKVGFPVNAAVSVVVAALLVAVALGAVVAVRRFVVPVALAVQVASIGALVASRGDGIFDWVEKGWDADAKQVLAVEVVAVVLLVAFAVVPALLDRRRSAPS